MADSTRKILEKIALKIDLLRPDAENSLPAGPKRSRPLFGILALALLVAIILPLINITVIFPAYSTLLIANIENSAERLAAHAIPPSAKYEIITHHSIESTRLLADIYRLEKEFGLLKIGLYSPEGATLYSSDASEMNTINKDPQFLRVVAKGGVHSKLSSSTRLGPDGKNVRIDVVKTNIPLMRDGVFLGAFEFQFDISDVKSSMDRFNTYATYGSILTSLCILLVVIVLLNKETSRLSALRQADTLREDVDRITKHDLKSPLVGALNGINFLEQYTQTTDEQKEMLGEMRESVITGLNLINRSLDIYKMETGKYTFQPVLVDMAAVCRRVASDLSGLAADRNVSVTILRTDTPEGTPDSLSAYAEETLCYSLFANLVKNAIEASEPDSEVIVSLSSNAVITVNVHNTGTVPDSIRDIFFDKFATAGKHGGTGLGTYSARLMARTMGGTISMDSSDETGTTVTVTLPKEITIDKGA